jgi:transcriptional regulator with XRE-family HTH domain
MAETRTAGEELERLAVLMEAANLTRREAARIGGVSEDALCRWYRSKRSPHAALVAGVVHRVAESALTRVRLRDGHHLYYKPGCGWMMRATIQVCAKRVGKRVKRSLGTHDVFEAIRLRNHRIDEWKRLGLSVADRRQAPQRKRKEG